MAEKKRKTAIAMDGELMDRVDALAVASGTSRSFMISKTSKLGVAFIETLLAKDFSVIGNDEELLVRILSDYIDRRGGGLDGMV